MSVYLETDPKTNKEYWRVDVTYTHAEAVRRVLVGLTWQHVGGSP